MPTNLAESLNISHASFPSTLNAEAIAHLRAQNWVMLTDIAPSEDLVESVLSPLGTLLPQYGQHKFWRVEAKETDAGTSLGDHELRLHTELAEFQYPPEYVALYAFRQADEGGALKLYDASEFLASLDPEMLQKMMSQQLSVEAEGPIATRYGSYGYTAPVLSVSPSGLNLRLDQHFIDKNGSSDIRNFRDKLLAHASSRTTEIKQPTGSLIIWNNRCVLHGRTAFKGKKRLLWRMCIREKGAVL